MTSLQLIFSEESHFKEKVVYVRKEKNQNLRSHYLRCLMEKSHEI